MAKKEVFVTYSWDNNDHKERVIQLTNTLRERGYNAEMDILQVQTETALDFMKMMHQAMTDYEKVIIVLSPGYKLKAEEFKGGVGQEFSLILKDINANSSKYILVSFEGITDEIYPLGLKHRDTVDLSQDVGISRLLHKLESIPEFAFSEVGIKKKHLTPKQIPSWPEGKILSTPEAPLQIIGIKHSNLSSSQIGGYYKRLEKSFYIEVKNIGNSSIDEFNVEVSLPNLIVFNYDSDLPENRVDGNRRIFTSTPDRKYFPGQVFTTFPIELKITAQNIKQLIDDKILVTAYTEQGLATNEFEFSELLIINRLGREEFILTPDHFVP